MYCCYVGECLQKLHSEVCVMGHRVGNFSPKGGGSELFALFLPTRASAWGTISTAETIPRLNSQNRRRPFTKNTWLFSNLSKYVVIFFSCKHPQVLRVPYTDIQALFHIGNFKEKQKFSSIGK